MAIPQGMETFEARLASFSTAQAKGKKRASSAKGGKGAKWPHASPSPSQLAQAGFFFKPSSSSPDNVQCFSCGNGVDGWESDDDPAKEHVALSPECGWAIQVALEQADEGDDLRTEDPMSEKMVEARRATFGDMWPHERKRGWTCKVQKMIEAGWYYCPSPESDDYAKCAYCGLGLDGWEPKDKPLDEHKSRSPTCAFFTSQTATKAGATKSKKGRQSKASRLSTQSSTTVATEDQQMHDASTDHRDSIGSTATDMSMLSTTSKTKKVGRPKKGQTKAKARTTRAKAAESQVQSSFVEPEDDDFAVKIASPPAKSTRGKKRTSEEMQAGDVEYPVMPPPKRNTRTRSSTVKPESLLTHPQEDDMPMENVEEPVSAPRSKKGGKGGRKRASSTTRKPSGRKASTRSASTASKASLRAQVPADEEIDAQLQADLERFSSDSDENWKVLGKDESVMSGVHMPRARPSAAGNVASLANIRRGPDSSVVISQEEVKSVGENNSVILEEPDPLMSSPVLKKPTRGAAKKSKKPSSVAATKARGMAKTNDVDNMDIDPENVQKQQIEASPLHLQESNEASLPDDMENVQEQNNMSQLTMTTAADDSGHETDGSVLAQNKAKRNSKKPATKKGKQAKKTTSKLKKVEVTVEIPIMPANEVPEVEAEEEPAVEEAPVVVVKTKFEKPLKAKSTKGQGKFKKVSAESLSRPADSSMVHDQEEQEATTQTIQEADHGPLVEVHIERPQAPTPTLPQSPKCQAPSPTPTPQSSDAENHPPSTRPSQIRPPLARFSPSPLRTMRVPLAPSTPTGSPSRGNNARLKTTYPWSAADLDYILMGTPSPNKEDVNALDMQNGLTSPEKKMHVDEWIKHNAKQGEEKLRMDCERIVGKFEDEGVRALKALEGIVCSD